MIALGILILMQPEPGANTPLAIALSNDGARVAYKWSGLHLVIKDGGAPRKLEGGSGATQFAFSHDGKKIIASMAGGGVAIWDSTDGTLLKRIKSKGSANGFAVTQTGDLIAVGGYNRTVEVFDVASGQRICATDAEAETKEHFRSSGRDTISGKVFVQDTFQYAVDRLSFSPDGTMLATRGMDGTFLRVWNAKTGTLVCEIRDRTRSIIGWSKSGRFVYDLGGIRCWDSQTGEAEMFANQSSNVFGSVEAGANSYTVTDSGRIGLLTYSGRVLLFSHGEAKENSAIQLDPWDSSDASYLSSNATFVGAIDQARSKVRVWDAKSGALSWTRDIN